MMNTPIRLATIAAALALAGAAQAATMLTIAEPADIRSTNPGVNRDNTTDGVVLNMVEGLVGYRDNGTVAPLLAKSVDVSDDGLTYTFKLREGVKFHNGAPLTAADVLWNWQRYMDPKTDWRCRSDFDGRNDLKVTEVSAPDPMTVVMKINHKSAVFLDSLARTDCGMTAIVHKDSVKADGSWDKPIGTGPFKFREWKRGEYTLVEAFKEYQSPPGDKPDGYVGSKRPLVDEVKFLVVPDPSTAKAGLLSGAIDASQITNSDAGELSKNAKLSVFVPHDATKHVLLLQTRDPLLKNVKLRQAMAAALDIPQIVLAASEGLGQLNNSAVPAGSAYYTDAQKRRFKYDPARVQQLLKEAGYKGEPIVIYANKRAHVPSYQIAVMAQAMLQAAGINAQIEVIEWATQLDRYNSGKYQVSSFSYSSRLDPALSFEQFAGDKDKQARKVWEDPKALALIDASFLESDPAKRQAIFDELQTLMLEQVPLIVFFNGADAWASSKRLTAFNAWEGKPLAWETAVK
ncbi:ABC transporter substrate-binding protein [Bordetella avium]|uniref:ABC transporter, substrate-binding protein n=1 Tax=Bordetella avium (strain 197N) TaxID=360910 RepID=Q2KWU2_BORA1|nr:ABC transporter substrate-binding protein [Bordetella avium]AZY49955.1 peptide ABC transporter substrate-binding protein [Bordetella avium]AZY53323.1 peptide ABC transporter substrate-binding protein [Bordetella avium]RIQ17312.1 ABC transporter substrate-binding protein [Bordetella avium]RIQ33797.1 ABC transporter substrate-binding protein [Bordetella avium]RIQ51989.1 ABC transporter substrate-binding protein [Bordetella avium]